VLAKPRLLLQLALHKVHKVLLHCGGQLTNMPCYSLAHVTAWLFFQNIRKSSMLQFRSC
jgi:hypothetical protein